MVDARCRALDAYLAAAAAPGRPAEVAGAQAALAAFRAAGRPAAARVNAPSRLRAATGRTATVPVAAVLVVVAGGVSLAAVTGLKPILPLGPPHTSPSPTTQPTSYLCGSTCVVPMPATTPTSAPPSTASAEPSTSAGGQVPMTKAGNANGISLAGAPLVDSERPASEPHPTPPPNPTTHKPPTPGRPKPPPSHKPATLGTSKTPPSYKPPMPAWPKPPAQTPAPSVRLSPSAVQATRPAAAGCDARCRDRTREYR